MHPRRIKIIAAIVFTPLIVIAALVSGLYLYLQTDSGRQTVVRQVEQAVNDPAGLSLELGKIQGNLFSNFSLSSLRLRDGSGEWLEITDISLDWSPMDLLGGKLRLNKLSLSSLNLMRAPVLPDSEGEEEPGSPLFPLPLDISLRQIKFAEVHIAEPVLGREALLQVAVNLKSEVEGVIQSTLDITQLDAHEGAVSAKVLYHPLDETLSVDVRLMEPAGGLIARALDLPKYPEVDVSFVGEGPLDDWRGKIDASAGELFASDLSLHSSGLNGDDQIINLNLSGGIQLNDLMAAPIPLVDDKRISLDAQLSWSSKDNRVQLVSSQMKNTSFDVVASGTVDLEEEKIDFSLNTDLLETTELNKLINPASLSRGNLILDATGTFQNPSLTTTFQLGGIVVDEVLSIGEIFGSISTDLSLRDMEIIPVTGSAALTEISGLPPEAANLIGSSLRVELDSHYRLGDGVLNVPLLRGRGRHISTDLRAALATKSNAASAEISVLVDDLAAVAPVQGKVLAIASLKSLNIAREMTGKIKIQAQDLDLGDKDIEALVSRTPSMTVDVVLGNENLQLSNIAVVLPVATLGGGVQLPLSFENIAGNIQVVMNDLSRFSKVAGSDVKGIAKLESTLSGSLSDPGLQGTLQIKDIVLNQSAFGNLETTYDAKNLTSGAGGILKAHLSYPGIPTDLALAFSLPSYSNLQLTDISVKALTNTISGSVNVPLDGAPITGNLNGQAPDLTFLARVVGMDVGGSTSADIMLSDQQGQQHVDVEFQGSNISASSESAVVKTLVVTAKSTGDFSDPSIELSTKASDILIEDRVVELIEFSAYGKLTNADFNFGLSSSAEPALQLSGKGIFALPSGENVSETKLRISALNGHFARKEIILRTPFSLTVDKGITRFDPFELAFDRGILVGSGEVTDISAVADLEIRALPLDLLTLIVPNQVITGTLDGEVHVALMPESSRGQIRMTAGNVELAGDENTNLPPITSQLTGTLDAGRFEFKNEITGLEASTIEAYGSVPVIVSFTPLVVELPDNQPVTGGVKVDSDIQNLWRYLALDTQEMSGKILVDTQLAGTFSNPEIVGGAKITEGNYENIEFGTLLRQLELEATIQNSNTVLLKLDAKDGKGGTFKTAGMIRFQDLVNPLLDLNVQLNNLSVLDQDQASVQTDGNINVKGTPAGLNVAGSITTREVNLNIGSAVAPSVVNLDVIEKNRPGSVVASSEAKDQKPPSKVVLDLILGMPRKVFLRGKGLDSEWEGRFTIKGTANDPVIEGYLSPVRGQFSFAGKDFKLQKGKIALIGGTKIDPELNLSAIYEARNVTAVVSINGTASNPKISFSSPDGLPEDEVISQVLFGKAAGKLTPVEALQLASAVASLSGKIDSGGGIMDFARETLGVDVLSAGTNADTGDAQVSVGKYINDNIYVGVDQGATAGSTRAKVQIELTPNITLESETGQTADSKVGVFWKWDY
ncbi:translocation/assembly module TamB domain-containing protein [Kiloniella antarctica]